MPESPATREGQQRGEKHQRYGDEARLSEVATLNPNGNTQNGFFQVFSSSHPGPRRPEKQEKRVDKPYGDSAS